MPISFKFNPERNLVTVLAEGIITDDDMRCYRKDLISDPRFCPGMKVLSDHRSVEQHMLSVEGVYRNMQENGVLKSQFKDCRQAIVTNSDLHFGMTRMYQVMMSDIFPNIKVFRDIDEAEAWLFEETGQEDAES